MKTRKPDLREYEDARAPFDDVMRRLLQAKPIPAKKLVQKRSKAAKRRK